MILTRVKNEVGATAIEYGLIASLVAVVAVSGMSAVGMNLSNTYCTISKHLGGSGTCLGSGSSGTGGNGSAGSSTSGNGSNSNGSSTGSVNSTNSYAEGATMDQVDESLKDPINKNYEPSLYGGSDSAGGIETFKSEDGDAVPTLAEYLRNINATDPITNVFGAYDSNDQSPVTDYNTVMADLKNGGSNILTGGYGEGNNIEVTTASGKVYILKADSDDGSVAQTENTPLKK